MLRRLVATLVMLSLVAFAPAASAQRTVIIVRDRPPPRRYYRVVRRVPPGYHLEERPRTGLIVTGAVLTLIGTSLLVGAVVDGGSRRNGWSSGDEGAAIFGGLFDVIGIPMLIVGSTSHRLVLVPNAALAPTSAVPHLAEGVALPRATGASLSLSF